MAKMIQTHAPNNQSSIINHHLSAQRIYDTLRETPPRTRCDLKNYVKVFLGLDMKEDAATVSKFVKDGKYSWTFLLDSEGHAANSYLVTGVPETYLVDSKGLVQDFKIGGMTYQEFDSKLAKIK